MNRFRVTAALLAATITAALLAATPAVAQDKVQQCSSIQITVDEQKGPGNWANTIETLKLRTQGQGWTTEINAHVKATKGKKYRLNFGDGTHPIDVKASASGSALEVTEGSRPAIVLVDVQSGSGAHAIRFEITGASSPRAKINGCPGGSLYFDIL